MIDTMERARSTMIEEISPNSKTILLITEAPHSGGTDTFCVILAENLKKQGWKTKLLVNKEHANLAELSKSFEETYLFNLQMLSTYSKLFGIFYRLLILFLYPFLYLSVSLNVWRTIRKTKPELVIVVNGGFPGGFLTYGALLGCSMSSAVQTIYSIHNYTIYPWHFVLYNAIIERVSSLFGKHLTLTTVSEQCKKDIETHSFLHKPLYVIHNGIPDPLVNPPSPKPLTDTPHLVCVANFEPRKGQNILISAFLKLKFANVTLTFYGRIADPDYYRSLKVLANNHPNIHFISGISDKMTLFSDKHLLILPSISHESFGLVLLEAMAFGIPVLASDGLGMSEVIEKDPNFPPGLLFKRSNSNDLKKKIERIFQDKNTYERYSRNARYLYENYFTDDKMINNYLSMITKT